MQFQEIRLKLTVTSHDYVRQLAYDYMYIRVLVHVYMQNTIQQTITATVSNIIFDGRDQGGNLFSSNNAPSRENAAVAGRHQHHLQWLRRDMGVTFPTIGQRGKTLSRYL